MSDDTEQASNKETGNDASLVCPVCGAALIAEKCKLVCRSEVCTYRIVFNCAEF